MLNKHISILKPGFWESISYPESPETHPYYIVMMTMIYLASVYYVIPTYLRSFRGNKPLQLRQLMFYYNIVNVICNFVLCCFALYSTNGARTTWGCQHTTNPLIINLTIAYAYLMLKFLDYLDTFIFALRGKWKQVCDSNAKGI